MAKQTELELTAQQAAQPEETPAKKTAAKKTAAKKPATKKATTKKTTTKTKAAKAEDGETAAEKPAAKRTTKKAEAKPWLSSRHIRPGKADQNIPPKTRHEPKGAGSRKRYAGSQSEPNFARWTSTADRTGH